MAKNLRISIPTIFGTIGIVAIGVFCYIFQNTAIAIVPTSEEINPYFSHSSIPSHGTKPTFSKQRPQMQYPDLKPNVKTSYNPSYHSDHSTMSIEGATMVDYAFSENQTEGDIKITAIGHSRLWEGVHFPIDDFDGLELGKKIGNWIVSKIKHQ